MADLKRKGKDKSFLKASVGLSYYPQAVTYFFFSQATRKKLGLSLITFEDAAVELHPFLKVSIIFSIKTSDISDLIYKIMN